MFNYEIIVIRIKKILNGFNVDSIWVDKETSVTINDPLFSATTKSAILKIMEFSFLLIVAERIVITAE